MSHDLAKRIQRLKAERDAVILAHNYQPAEIQDIADHVGDSLELARLAARDNRTLVVCGVRFMAETAAILNPDKTVLIPDPLAGCSLADAVQPEALIELKRQHPSAAVVAYVNSSAAVKAESDVCVTSANAVRIAEQLPQESIVFVPDRNLGQWVSKQTGKRVILWPGYCPTHHMLTAGDIMRARRRHQDALVVVHPECRPEVAELADEVCSTGLILKLARQTAHRELVIGTEAGLLHRLQKENPDKEFYLVRPELICPSMKCTDLEQVLRVLEDMGPTIVLPEDIRERAERALTRMLAMS